MSRYTARCTRFDAELTLDPADPCAARVTATVDPRSLETHNSDGTAEIIIDAEFPRPVGASG